MFENLIGHKDFEIRKCEYSLNQLKDCMNAINLFRDNNPEYFLVVSNLYYVSEPENKEIGNL